MSARMANSNAAAQSGSDLGEAKDIEVAGYDGGLRLQPVLTPGGTPANTDLIVAASSHRKFANPIPTCMYAFATTSLTYSVLNCGIKSVPVPTPVVAFAVFYGGLGQYLGSLWEFASGNTLGATLFGSLAFFWWGTAMLYIPWFGELGNYDATSPGVYTASGFGAAEAQMALGLYFFVWFGIATLLTIPCIKASIALLATMSLFDVMLLLYGISHYTGNTAIRTAAASVGIVMSVAAFYVGSASFFTPSTSYITLKTGRLSKTE